MWKRWSGWEVRFSSASCSGRSWAAAPGPWPGSSRSARCVGFLLVLLAYLQAPRIYDGCSDCEQYLGRWWEPVFVGFIVAVGFVTYLVGIGVGALGRAVVGLARSD